MLRETFTEGKIRIRRGFMGKCHVREGLADIQEIDFQRWQEMTFQGKERELCDWSQCVISGRAQPWSLEPPESSLMKEGSKQAQVGWKPIDWKTNQKRRDGWRKGLESKSLICRAAELQAGTNIQEIQSEGSNLDSRHKVDIRVTEEDGLTNSEKDPEWEQFCVMVMETPHIQIMWDRKFPSSESGLEGWTQVAQAAWDGTKRNLGKGAWQH